MGPFVLELVGQGKKVKRKLGGSLSGVNDPTSSGKNSCDHKTKVAYEMINVEVQIGKKHLQCSVLDLNWVTYTKR